MLADAAGPNLYLTLLSVSAPTSLTLTTSFLLDVSTLLESNFGIDIFSVVVSITWEAPPSSTFSF